eukprot:2382300-Prorocentrum_lima.AAC.1
MVICGNFATDSERLWDSTSTQNVDIGLLRMVLSLTDGRLETTTTTDINTAFLNAPMYNCSPNSFEIGNCRGRNNLGDSKSLSLIHI